jgi:iron-sulfur cluster repair protein YtfE (RIC family)
MAKLEQLKPGQRVRITQIVKVGSTKTWPLVVEGVFRHVDSLATGLATDRLKEDDIVIPVIHFTKDNKEMSSIAVDEQTKIDVI